MKPPVAILCLLLSAVSFGQNGDQKLVIPPKKLTAVSNLEVKVQGVTTTAPTPSGNVSVVTLDLEQPTEFGTGLTEMLITALVQSERFIVLERLGLDEISREQQGNNNANLLNAQIVVKGAITELKLRRSGSGVGGTIGEQASFSQTKVDATVGLDLRIIEVATGRVLDSVHTEGKATSTRKSFNFTKDELSFGTASFDEGPLGGAVRDAITNSVKAIVNRTEKVEWEAKVIDAEATDDGTQIYMNAGAKAGIKVGDIFSVRKAGRLLLDPDTQVPLGRTKGKTIGKIKVIDVSEGVAIAIPLEGEGFEPGDVISLPPKKPEGETSK